MFGPFRDTRAATRARDALYKHFRLRPCDFDFKPAHDLPDGLVADVARALDGSGEVAEIPAWVRRAGGRSLVVERGRAGLEVYPIVGGGVIEEAAVAATPDGARAVHRRAGLDLRRGAARRHAVAERLAPRQAHGRGDPDRAPARPPRRRSRRVSVRW